ncbi:MAG TPA: phosphate signaling complex protein PhoU [Candidatus Anaerofilum faecale]|nr:phosphate signaling complex protein PhoU [Anaerofilum sp. An201]OUP04419.1 phosphate transport system regulatory protein PhoU [Anaerofilum sp. An201]HIX12479.1 phosphate signaling complex protein PhoU [Candidatus Anaerofilum faecale]
MSIRETYDLQLEKLSEELIRMGAAARQAVQQAVDALKNSDVELARAVMKGDEAIDRMERDIEHQCLTLLLRQQPVAGDLRKVGTAIKMITDVERIGDAASDIAELSTHIRSDQFPTLLPHILQLAGTVSQMTDDAIRAYVQEDLKLAGEVIDRDDIADEAFCAIKREIAQNMAGNPAGVDAALDCLMVAKYLERVGDHAVNICEWVQFYKTGIHKHERIV